MSNRKLSNIFIYPKFQFTLLLAQIIVSIITFVVIHFKVNEAFQRLSDMGSKINLPVEHAYYSFIEHSRNMISTNLNWALSFSVFLTIVASLYLSHKVVGPIHRLRIYFRAIISGAPQHDLKFRKGDYFEDLPDLINESLKINKK